MKSRNTGSISTRFLLRLGTLLAFIVAVMAARAITAGIVGNPGPGAMPYMQDYDMTVTGDTTAPVYVYSVGLLGKEANQVSWQLKGGPEACSGQGTHCTHTWNVVDADYGNFWWMGYAYDTNINIAYSDAYGPYMTWA